MAIVRKMRFHCSAALEEMALTGHSLGVNETKRNRDHALLCQRVEKMTFLIERALGSI